MIRSYSSVHYDSFPINGGEDSNSRRSNLYDYFSIASTLGILILFSAALLYLALEMKRRSIESKCPRKTKQSRVSNEKTVHPHFVQRNGAKSRENDLMDEEVEEARMENDSLMAVSSNVDVMVKHLYEDDGCSTSDISQLRIDDLPLAVLGCVASNLPYRDLRTFRVVNRHFYYADRVLGNSYKKFSISLVKQLFPSYIHYPGSTMFSMGRALIATLRYLSQFNMNISEIDLNGFRVFSSTHFNDVIEKSKIPRDQIFKKVEVIASNNCAVSFDDLKWFSRYAPNVTHLKLREAPLSIECEEESHNTLELKDAVNRIVKQKNSDWTSTRRKVVLELKTIFRHLNRIEFY